VDWGYQGARLRAFGKRHAPDRVRSWIWDWEYRTGKWDHIESNEGGLVYDMITKHSHGGGLLDLACGSGTVRMELPSGALIRYVGVDISTKAIARARQRAAGAVPLPEGERFLVGSITDPAVQREVGDGFDVVLFNECIYYFPPDDIPALVRAYAQKLQPSGTVIVRIHDRMRWREQTQAVRDTLEVVDEHNGEVSTTLVGIQSR
jgi:SAM-dependent methyltransferase